MIAGAEMPFWLSHQSIRHSKLCNTRDTDIKTVQTQNQFNTNSTPTKTDLGRHVSTANQMCGDAGSGERGLELLEGLLPCANDHRVHVQYLFRV